MSSHPLLRLSVIVTATTLTLAACGQILPRPTPTPPPTTTATRLTSPAATDTPVPAQPTATPTVAPQTTPPTATPTPIPPPPGGALKIGQTVRVVAADGLNVREKASTQAKRLGRFASGALVKVEGGPEVADGYNWWQVSDQGGLKGWVAEKSQTGETWLTPNVGEPRPVARPVRKGDQVVVTTDQPLSLRFQAGLNAVVDRRVEPGTRLTVRDGPVDADGRRWWQLVDKNGREGWASEGTANDRWLTPIE
ncbi:MAG: SH3 domain-containing protein [Anaerolineae bacterium]|nr:SH3 domain-containing protein [Anaerolineae bacterium]